MTKISLSLGAISLIQLLVACSATAEPINIPVTRRSSAVRDIHYYAAAADRVRARYGFPTSNNTRNSRAINSAKFGKRANSAGISITDQDDDSSYFGSISIGTPGQSMNVVLDSGSSDLWVVGTDCQGCSSQMPRFDSTKSSSFKASSSSSSSSPTGGNGGQNGGTTINYGSGTVSGTTGQETVTMGGFTVQSQTFLLASSISQNLINEPVSGIMGLAFQSIASTQSTPFWQQLVNAGDLSSPEMGVWLERQGSSTPTISANGNSEAPGGVFTLGGTNTSLFSGNIEFLNTQGTPSFWLLNLNTLTVQSKSVSLGSSAQLAAIDTGTTLIGGPTDAVQSFYSSIEGSATVQNQQGFFSFPCDTTLNTTISFGGTAWPISPQDMNLGPVSSGSNDCIGGLFDLSLGSNIPSDSSNPSWVVGDVFLKNVYTVFRGSTTSSGGSSSGTPAVGFAQLSSQAGGSGTAPGNAGESNAGSSSNEGSRTGAGVSDSLSWFLGAVTILMLSQWGFF